MSHEVMKSISEAYVSMVSEAKKNYYEIGGDRYDGGVVVKVYANGKEVYSDILDGEQNYKYKGKEYDNIDKLLDAIAKRTPGVSSWKDFERVKMK